MNVDDGTNGIIAALAENRQTFIERYTPFMYHTMRCDAQTKLRQKMTLTHSPSPNKHTHIYVIGTVPKHTKTTDNIK